MEEIAQEKMPTGISSLDPVLNGGIPPGSVVLLVGRIGAGTNEFVYSSILSLSEKKEETPQIPGIIMPTGITYITFSKLPTSIIEEIALSFPKYPYEKLFKDISFIDLSEMYFESSIVPAAWYSSSEDILNRFQKKKKNSENILGELAIRLNEIEAGSLIIIDSLTEIATQQSDTKSWNELTAFLRGLERVSKNWKSTIYILLSDGVLDQSRFIEVADCCDAVINFHWEESSARQRQRIMYFEKFRGVMPHLEAQDLVKFGVRITPEGGYEVSNIRVII